MIHIRIPARLHELPAELRHDIDALVAKFGRHGIVTSVVHDQGAITVPPPETTTTGAAAEVTVESPATPQEPPC
jgi:peptidyl-tRNA hydrolase